LNWINAEFVALLYLRSTAPTTPATANRTPHIESYIRRRNTRAQPKTGFATDIHPNLERITQPKLRDTPPGSLISRVRTNPHVPKSAAE
jgi:hypothetical protein